MKVRLLWMKVRLIAMKLRLLGMKIWLLSMKVRLIGMSVALELAHGNTPAKPADYPCYRNNLLGANCDRLAIHRAHG